MKQFKSYLKNKNFAETTIRNYTVYVSRFLRRLKDENTEAEEVKYNDILAFIEHLKEQEKSTETVNRYLLSIRHYYEYLNIGISPAQGVILKGIKRIIPADLLDEKTLNALYENYPNTDFISKRNKVITGLFVYQAITRAELEKLKPEHILLNKAKIIIPPAGKTKQRTLPLNALQISELQEYMQSIRPELLKQYKLSGTRLFIGNRGSNELQGSLKYLYKTLKQINKSFKNAQQIRMSVIRNKLKTMNLREVQYFAGHGRVISTEKYKLDNIEDLKKETEKYHPLRGL